MVLEDDQVAALGLGLVGGQHTRGHGTLFLVSKRKKFTVSQSWALPVFFHFFNNKK